MLCRAALQAVLKVAWYKKRGVAEAKLANVNKKYVEMLNDKQVKPI